MVIPIEYMSDLLVGRLPVLDPNISGRRRSLGHQRVVRVSPSSESESGVEGGESRSAAVLVSPMAARQAHRSSETRIFSYTKLSATYCWKQS